MPVFLNGKWRVRVFRAENGSDNQSKQLLFLVDMSALLWEIAETTAQCWSLRQASLAIGKQLRWQERNPGFAPELEKEISAACIAPSRPWRHDIRRRIESRRAAC